MWIWFADRGTSLVAYGALWLSVLTGIAYNARGLGSLHIASRALHVPASVIASAALLMHVVIGTIDAGLVLTAQVPHPAYSNGYFLVGLAVGIVALLITITAILAFVDPKQFERPWDPRTVHAFSYAGFAFATIHAIAVGSDIYAFVRPGLVALTLLLLAALVARVLTAPKQAQA